MAFVMIIPDSQEVNNLMTVCDLTIIITPKRLIFPRKHGNKQKYLNIHKKADLTASKHYILVAKYHIYIWILHKNKVSNAIFFK